MTRLASHISETAVTTGTGNLTLAGSAVNRRSFNAEYGLNKRFPYQIEHEGTDWEEGVGYLSGTTTFIRETVMRSSNADALVNFGVGEKNISVDFISMMQFGYVTKVLSVTDSDVTAQVGTHYELDVSGLTASRNFALPTAKTGDQIRVKLTTGDADHELIIKGAATVTINGGTAATEWSRLFIDDEVVEFRATSATNWDVVHDGRIAPSMSVGNSSGASVQSIANGVDTKIASAIDTVYHNKGGLWDVTNKNIIIRRAGQYLITGGGGLQNIVDQKRIRVMLHKDTGSGYNMEAELGRNTSSGPTNQWLTAYSGYQAPFDAGDDIALYINHTDTTSRNTAGTVKNIIHLSSVWIGD